MYRVTESVVDADNRNTICNYKQDFWTIDSAFLFIIKKINTKKHVTCSVLCECPICVSWSFADERGYNVVIGLYSIAVCEEESKYIRVTDNCLPLHNTVTAKVAIQTIQTNENGSIMYSVVLSVGYYGGEEMRLEYCGDNSTDIDQVYNLWKSRIYDKVPDGCNKEWFLDHGFDFC